MLKLSKLYTSNESIFPVIIFKDGLNIVFANVTKELKNKSSHSLGKTTFVDVLNFVLLKKFDKSFFLKKSIFHNLIFYLEIEYDINKFITIRRPVNGKICIHSSPEKSRFNHLESNQWEHSNLGLESAKNILDSYVNLIGFKENNFTFRNGLRYCFRKQTQYENTFKVNSSREPDSGWKPYLAQILGINSSIVKNKYAANQEVELLKNAINQLELLPKESTQSLEAEIAQLESHISRMKVELDAFDFRRTDIEINNELVEIATLDVSELNNEIYEIDQKIIAINKSLNAQFSFDLEKIIELFHEVNIHFPEQLTNSYQDLINLNIQMSEGRKERLKKTKNKLSAKRKTAEHLLKDATEKQQKLAEILLQKDAFKKYKTMNSRLAKEESRLAVLQERVDKLDNALLLKDKLESAFKVQYEAGKALEKTTRIRENPQMKNALEIFSGIVEDVLSMSAFIFTDINSDNNLEFKVKLKDQTSVSDGFSYTRTLSAIFDMTILLIHAKDSFYKFCFHDGLFESLDDRIKFKLISKMKCISERYGFQFIITVLDSDLPISEDGERTYFSQNDVILNLNDKGDAGRLFKMPAF